MTFFNPFTLFNHLRPSLLVQSSRGNKMKVLKSWTGGIKYPGFKYFPRPGEVDPPYEASKLFLVQRIKPFWGNSVPMKRTLTSIGLGDDKRVGCYAIVKNTTDMNARLWKIKHLIKITPITTPDGLPANDDLSACHLDYNTGVLKIRKDIGHDENRLKLADDFVKSPKRVNTDVWKKNAREKWITEWW